MPSRTLLVNQFAELCPLTAAQGPHGSNMHLVQRSLIIGHKVLPKSNNKATPPSRKNNFEIAPPCTSNSNELETAQLSAELCFGAASSACELGAHFLRNLVFKSVPVLFTRTAVPPHFELGFEIRLKKLVQLFRERQTHFANVLRKNRNFAFSLFQFSPPNPTFNLPAAGGPEEYLLVAQL
jgi:hypothetical protein